MKKNEINDTQRSTNQKSKKKKIEVFNKHAEGEKWIAKTSVKKMLIELGANPEDLTESKVDEIIKVSNLGGNEKIEFREFLIACAVGLFLRKGGEHHSTRFQEIREGFLVFFEKIVVRHAFEQIDENKSEEIDFEELKSAFLSMREDDLIQERLKELDFNGDKTIEFPEFVYGMCAWVGMSGDDADDIEDPESLSPQVNNKNFDLQDELEHVRHHA
ncbi:hypothetical protein RFI_13573 [Reticulomyxa filosa]|uniref:EF-hand domain-containing protein n=1 Tax=Reticulomyxa filosa TaxID=46433 RepID=X6NE33_RETFI|nr:hypothetical protein RFI_13573 [Reticulomyxa filosa]|eukprot:ETO23607.1 hypothetical protein RFI_13573 [Reticulomyxa filosa]